MNIDKIRYLSFDLDGTLLNNEGKISPYSKQIIQRLQKKGYMIILNSGRFYHELECFCEELQLSTYGGYAICSNGYHVYHPQTKNVTKNPGIEVTDYQSLHPIMKRYSFLCFIYDHQDYGAITHGIYYWMFRFAKLLTCLPLPFGSKVRRYRLMVKNTKLHSMKSYTPDHELEKLCFIGLPRTLKRFTQEIDHNFSTYQFFHVNTFSTELVKKGVSKADALQSLLIDYGDDLSNVMAFGDAGNDVPLLQRAGIGVCMKNAKKTMRKHTPHSTAYTNDEDGVAKFLEETLL